MNTQKLLIIVAVVLVVIFAITIGVGGCQSSDEPDPNNPPGAVGALKGLQGNRFLEIGDKTSATCASPGARSFFVNGSCTINFQKRSVFGRATRVVFFATAGVNVTVDPVEGDTKTESVGPFQCVAAAIDRKGGTITISGNATISLLRRSC